MEKRRVYRPAGGSTTTQPAVILVPPARIGPTSFLGMGTDRRVEGAGRHPARYPKRDAGLRLSRARPPPDGACRRLRHRSVRACGVCRIGKLSTVPNSRKPGGALDQSGGDVSAPLTSKIPSRYAGPVPGPPRSSTRQPRYHRAGVAGDLAECAVDAPEPSDRPSRLRDRRSWRRDREIMTPRSSS